MTLQRRLTLIAALFAGLTVTAQAQLLVPHWSFHGSVAIPQGEFGDILSRTGYGFSMFGGAQIHATPVILGIEASVYEYGREVSNVPILYAVPDVTYRLTTVNHIITTHFVMRLQWRKQQVKPYAEGLIGLKYFYTASSLNDRYDYSIPSSVNLRDVAFSYGVGGGVDIFVARSFGANIHINAGVRYLLGGQAEYLKQGAILRSGGEYAHKANMSRTDALMPTFGLSFTM